MSDLIEYYHFHSGHKYAWAAVRIDESRFKMVRQFCRFTSDLLVEGRLRKSINKELHCSCNLIFSVTDYACNVV